MTDNTQPDSVRIITSSDILLHDAETALMYEELRAAIDDGHESMTHADALAEIAAIRAENAALQQGYDAARLEIDHLRGVTKMVARWYMVDKDGVATLCTDMEDAEQEAKDANLAWPHRAPHRAVQLVEVGTSAVAGESCPTCIALARTVMLDQVSFDRKPDCYGIRQITNDEGIEEWEDIRTSPDVAREEANDMMATGRGEIYEVVPLWTTPQPSPTPQADSQPAPVAQGDAEVRSNNMRIWKWKLAATDVQTIEVPAGAKLLDVQAQGGLPNLWALCDENAPSTPRRIAIYGTGNPMPDEPGEYIATFQMHGGALVFHAFELRAT